MVSKEEAKRLAEEKEGAKAILIDDHTDGVSYIVSFGYETFYLVNKETGDVKTISPNDLLI